MGGSNNASQLEMGHDAGHEQREWRIQRVGWALMLLLCAAALSGVLGDGPVSDTRAGKVGDALHVEYDRYVRHQAPFTVKVYCRPQAKGQFALALNRSYLGHLELKGIQPEPATNITAGDKSVFTFVASGDEEHLVTFQFEAEAIGKVENEFTLDGNTSRRTEQFIWP